MAGQREQEIIKSFIGFADRLVGEFDVLDLTTQLTQDCARLLDISAAGLLLADPSGILHLLAATSEQAQTLEAFQLQREEGPCLDCFESGVAVNVPDLQAEAARWPRFAAVAVAQGFASVHAVPVRLGDLTLGALGLFGSTIGNLNEEDLNLARGLAHVAAIALVQGDRPVDRAGLMPALQAAVGSRAVLEMAKGVLAEVYDVEMQEAFNRLRSYSHAHDQRLTEVARLVVIRTPGNAEILKELGEPALTQRG